MTQNVRINSRAEEREDELANDSDKSFIVPDGFEWDIQQIWVELQTTATVGIRQMAVEIVPIDGTDTLGNFFAEATQAESTARDYNFAPGLISQTMFISLTLNTVIPKLRLAPGERLRIFDFAAIDPAADDMAVRLMIQTNRI